MRNYGPSNSTTRGAAETPVDLVPQFTVRMNKSSRLTGYQHAKWSCALIPSETKFMKRLKALTFDCSLKTITEVIDLRRPTSEAILWLPHFEESGSHFPC